MSNGTAPAPTDVTLLRRAQSGDGQAFAAIYDRHAATAYRVAARLLPNRVAAEDAVQEAFVTLWRTGHYDASQGSVRAYLMAIVHNRAIDRLRRDRRHQADTPLDEAVADRLPAPERTEAVVEDGAVADVLRDAVTELPDEQRDAVELAYFRGLTHAEIATLRREPLGTVKGRVRLGLQKLGLDPSVAAWR